MSVLEVWCACAIRLIQTGCDLGNVHQYFWRCCRFQLLKPTRISSLEPTASSFVDSGGRESLDAAYIEFTKADLDNVENVSSQTEDPSFAGTKTNLVVDTAQNELELDLEPGVETASVGDMLAEDDTLILMEDDTDNTSILGLEGNKFSLRVEPTSSKTTQSRFQTCSASSWTARCVLVRSTPMASVWMTVPTLTPLLTLTERHQPLQT